MYEPPDLDNETISEPMQNAVSSQQNDITDSVEDQQGAVANSDTVLDESRGETATTSKSNPKVTSEEPAKSPYDEAMIRLLDQISRIPAYQKDRQTEQTAPTRQRASSVPRSRGADNEILRAQKFQPSQK